MELHILFLFLLSWSPTVTGQKGYEADPIEARKGCTSGQITSKNYPSLYPKNDHSQWLIVVRGGYRVKLTIHDLRIDFTINCTADSLQIFEGIEKTPITKPLCGLKTNVVFISTTNKVWLLFKSNGRIERRGFNLTYNSLCPQDSCGGDQFCVEKPKCGHSCCLPDVTNRQCEKPLTSLAQSTAHYQGTVTVLCNTKLHKDKTRFRWFINGQTLEGEENSTLKFVVSTNEKVVTFQCQVVNQENLESLISNPFMFNVPTTAAPATRPTTPPPTTAAPATRPTTPPPTTAAQTTAPAKGTSLQGSRSGSRSFSHPGLGRSKYHSSSGTSRSGLLPGLGRSKYHSSSGTSRSSLLTGLSNVVRSKKRSKSIFQEETEITHVIIKSVKSRVRHGGSWSGKSLERASSKSNLSWRHKRWSKSDVIAGLIKSHLPHKHSWSRSHTRIGAQTTRPYSAPTPRPTYKTTRPYSAPTPRPAPQTTRPYSAPTPRPAYKTTRPYLAPTPRPAYQTTRPYLAPTPKPVQPILKPNSESCKNRCLEYLANVNKPCQCNKMCLMPVNQLTPWKKCCPDYEAVCLNSNSSG